MTPRDDDVDETVIVELRRLAGSGGRGGRQQAARASALRTLERLERRRRELAPMPQDWYPEGCADFAELDAGDSVETRARWYLAIGP